MKFAVFALIASVCLVSGASANIFKKFGKDFKHLEKEINIFQIFDRVDSLFDDSFDFLKVLLKDVKGVECVVQDALSLETIGQAAMLKIEACATALEKNGDIGYTEILGGLQDIFTIVQMLENFHSNEILEFQYEKLFTAVTKLMQTVQYVSKHAAQYEQAIKGDAQCLDNTVKSMVGNFEGFPAELKACQKYL